MSMPDFSEFGPNAGFVEEQYRLYLSDPSLVDDYWSSYFAKRYGQESAGLSRNGHVVYSAASAIQERATLYIEQVRSYGHLRAHCNPMQHASQPSFFAAGVGLDAVPFSDAELAEEVFVAGFAGQQRMKLGDLVNGLHRVYMDRVGFEFAHVTNTAEREWLRSRIEAALISGIPVPAAADRQSALRGLIEAECFEAELHKRYVGAKRFSAQGGETIIPMVSRIIEQCAAHAVERVILGMPHRGRLGILTCCLNKPLHELFCEFEDKGISSRIGGEDVKYHLGHRAQVRTSADKSVDAWLLSNPSHLEAVNPVVEGVVRALQDAAPHKPRQHVMGLRLHGDAAVMGQGVVAETYNFARLEGYSTQGTFHIIVNNQVGFTTDPEDGRSSHYCSEWAKAIEAPVVHVSAEDVDACLWLTDLLFEFRQKFQRDVVVDLYCYRKYGHNEGDDPTYTQPLLYSEIKEKKPIYVGYSALLEREGVADKAFVDTAISAYKERFKAEQEVTSKIVLGECSPLRGMIQDRVSLEPASEKELRRYAKLFTDLPAEFSPHPKLKQILEKRAQSVEEGQGIEWGVAELLSYGTMLSRGLNVRLTGQDVGRGTFSHRHAVLHAADLRKRYLPLSALSVDGAGRFEVYNSPLSEEGCLAFEFGYSAISDRSLVLWEAQFGDFANEAQVPIDQFISSSESKWNMRSGLVMLLPHGFEGQGPEHSSARLERFLQLCAEGNMSVCYPTSAAQQFHLLRRQGFTTVRRPLIVMTPKILLRLPAAAATMEQLVKGSFAPVLETRLGDGRKLPLVLTCGKIFYEIEARLVEEKKQARILRIEQLYPFPETILSELAAQSDGQALWVQEEPANMGAWSYIEPRLRALGLEVQYAGRPASASPACGSPSRHAAEQKKILDELVQWLSKDMRRKAVVPRSASSIVV